jgi:hypothetical protein
VYFIRKRKTRRFERHPCGKRLGGYVVSKYTGNAFLKGIDVFRWTSIPKSTRLSARPPSTTYQIQKFARRNRALVAGVAAVFVVLVLGMMASTWEAVQARRAEKSAQQETAIAQAVNDFLQNDLLGQASAYNQAKPDPSLTVRTALDRAAQKIGGKFDSQPEVEAAIRQTMGDTYIQLGLYAEARRQLEAALVLAHHALADENPKTLSIKAALGRTLYAQGKYPQAEAILQGVLDARRRVLGPEHPDTLSSMNSLAQVDQAEGKYTQAQAIRRPWTSSAGFSARRTQPRSRRWTVWLLTTDTRPGTRSPLRSLRKFWRSDAGFSAQRASTLSCR